MTVIEPEDELVFPVEQAPRPDDDQLAGVVARDVVVEAEEGERRLRLAVRIRRIEGRGQDDLLALVAERIG